MVQALALGQTHPLRVNAPARVKHTTAAARLCCMARSGKFWAPGAKAFLPIMGTTRHRCTQVGLVRAAHHATASAEHPLWVVLLLHAPDALEVAAPVGTVLVG
jgi:hypothetical protein